MTNDAARYQRELQAEPVLALRILRAMSALPEGPERVIRCSQQNAERAVARALARATVQGQIWRVEIEEGTGDYEKRGH
jgi:hypothetical protein